ncbi:Uncharacterized protein SAMN04488120_10962 [Fontimonas thermophila]|uniref:Photosynthesis system II assembly factor Ycf48/Hcf136-like domain-containing protein n=1 Tax=Fontimonas thermophila TaxID=1076937 RepID=A0A1I2JPS3_9GAMM|nr:hypothetical protein [Fontimonas thermophila]SFF56955.1 Uncharacterized protein SAMN04488120_10962 [Fontimonas thermophila]
MNDDTRAQAVPRTAQRAAAWGAAWPSIAVAALVIVAAVYSFSPRPQPVFAPTQIYPDRLLVTGLDRQGERLIAVGEQGQILIADAAQGPWHSASVEPQRGSTFTRVRFVGDGVAVAVGHDGWIVRSTDGGAHWSEVHYGGDGSDPLLGVAGPYDGRLFAFGAFGLYLVSEDLGQTWHRRELVIANAAAQTSPAADPFASTDPNADPFANFDSSTLGGTGHLNDMARAADGALVLVGERGLLLRSTDRGETWTQLDEIYPGSLFGVLTLPSKTLVAFGMRGHAFRSEDNGLSWQEAKVPVATSLFAGAVAKDRVFLAGAGNTVLSSRDDGRTYELLTPSAGNTIAALLPLDDGRWLGGGDNGLAIQTAAGAAATQGEAP